MLRDHQGHVHQASSQDVGLAAKRTAPQHCSAGVGGLAAPGPKAAEVHVGLDAGQHARSLSLGSSDEAQRSGVHRVARAQEGGTLLPSLRPEDLRHLISKVSSGKF